MFTFTTINGVEIRMFFMHFEVTIITFIEN
jgi:hypothetical protein